MRIHAQRAANKAIDLTDAELHQLRICMFYISLERWWVGTRSHYMHLPPPPRSSINHKNGNVRVVRGKCQK
jgi:hypothetical protein